MATYTIAEDGRNGTVSLQPTGLERILKKRMGKDDRQLIPYGSVSHVEHNRKRVGSDVITIHTTATSIEWKIKGDAESFVDALNERIG